MAVKQVAQEKMTKDGRKWMFYTYVYNTNGTRKKYFSKLYFTKNEAIKAEREFLIRQDRHEYNSTDMTFRDLYLEFYNYKADKVKETTMRTYRERIKYLTLLDNVKIKDFNIRHYLQWRASIQVLPLAVKTKNHYHKFFKELLNYGTRWHDFNFTAIYNKMEKFSDPNAAPKEMDFYTYEEFLQFLNSEKDIKFRCAFEVLFYCGLRRGELRGLTWDNIDFKEKTLSVKKNVVNATGDHGPWKVTTPKTRTSTRTIPIPDVLVEDLKVYKQVCQRMYGFNDKWFVFGDFNPLTASALRERKNFIADKSNIRPIRIHDFRHSCASILINNGANIIIVAKYLGHAKIDETLNTYAHMFKNKMDDVVNMMNNLSRL